MMNHSNTSTNTTEELGNAWNGNVQLLLRVIASVQIVVIIVAICGNLFVCTAILVHQRLRKTTNYFIFSLAISDLLTACFSMSFDAETSLYLAQWSHGEFVCNLWAVMYMTAAPTSIFHLLAVSVDRYLALRSPFKYCHVMTRKKALLVVAAIWLYSFLFTIIPMAGWPYYDQSVMDGVCYFNIHPYYSIVSSFVNFILPSMAICVVYYNVYRIAREHASRIGKQQTGPTSQSNDDSRDSTVPSEKRVIKRNIKAAKTIAILVSALLFCWMPFTVFSTVLSFCHECFLQTPREVGQALLLLAYINSAFNPILYSLHNREFRESFRRLLKLQFTFR